MKNLTEIMMNPVRMRIVQFLIAHETATPSEIHAELSDVPTASLYRHIKILHEAGFLDVAAERQVRGTVERVYRLVPNPLGEMSTKEGSLLVQTAMLSIMTDFQQYFSNPENDPQRDMLGLSTSTLLMTDEEFADFTMRLNEVFNGVLSNTPAEGRKLRCITFISSPCTTEKRRRDLC